MIYVTMVYGPIAAFLVEFFPARIRYTSLSIPYHLGQWRVRRLAAVHRHRDRRRRPGNTYSPGSGTRSASR